MATVNQRAQYRFQVRGAEQASTTPAHRQQDLALQETGGGAQHSGVVSNVGLTEEPEETTQPASDRSRMRPRQRDRPTGPIGSHGVGILRIPGAQTRWQVERNPRHAIQIFPLQRAPPRISD